MASCEIVLDISNYAKIPLNPDPKLKETHGEQYFFEKLREYELAKQGNTTKKQFFLAVRWFLEKQLEFKDIPADVVGDESLEQEGLKVLDAKKALTEVEKARFFTIA